MDLPTSWIDAWTISKVMAEGLKYEQVSSELLKHIQEILTILVKHYGSILKQLNCIKIVHIMKLIILHTSLIRYLQSLICDICNLSDLFV